MTSITMYPAGNGDAFLIVHGQTTILVDGGYSSTFQSHILPELRKIADRGRKLDLVVSTHIDADHISGLVRFFSINGSAQDPKVVGVRQVWHNSLCSLALPRTTSHELSDGDRELFREICQRGYARPEPDLPLDTEIGALQSSSLASLIRAGKFNWNGGNGSQAIVAPYQLNLNIDVQITVLGPTPERLFGLRDWWINELRRAGIAGALTKDVLLEDVFEFVCSYETGRAREMAGEISSSLARFRQLEEVYDPDDSITNASSLSLIIETDKKRLLFLGDAWAIDIEKALSPMATAQNPLVFDAIKISHHGSRRNTSPALLSLIDSPMYFISSNGKRHNHPDVEVLRALVDRHSPFARELFFNFSTPASRELKAYTSRSATPFAVHEECREPVSIS